MSDSDATEETVWAEFYEVLNDLAGADYAARAGLRLVREQARASAAEAIDPNADGAIGVPNDDGSGATAYQIWPVSSLPDYFAADGAVAHLLSQQWVVFVIAEWDGHYRTRIAVARGARRKDVLCTVLGDLNKIRNDIVHHRGVATADNSGHCTTLVWFKHGDRIMVTPQHIAEFMAHFATPREQRGRRGRDLASLIRDRSRRAGWPRSGAPTRSGCGVGRTHCRALLRQRPEAAQPSGFRGWRAMELMGHLSNPEQP